MELFSVRLLVGIAITLICQSCVLLSSSSERVKSASTVIFYCTNGDSRCVQSLQRNNQKIDILGMIGYVVDRSGNVSGIMDKDVVELAKSRNIKLMPLILNSQFDQPLFHDLLHNPKGRRQMSEQLVRIAKEQKFYGWQFDFENIRVEDRDEYTSFYREIAEVLHKEGLKISIAVVPRTSNEPGASPYDHWMFENWRGAYDYAALAKIGDFVSLMTYDQHTKRTPPGPVAGMPWTVAVLKYLKQLSVDMSKVSLGIPVYSHHWFSTYNETRLGHMSGTQLSFAEANNLFKHFSATRQWDQNEKVTWSVWQNGSNNEYLFMEDARSFAAKIPLIQEYGLAGISAFRLGSEDPAVWEHIEPKHSVVVP